MKRTIATHHEYSTKLCTCVVHMIFHEPKSYLRGAKHTLKYVRSRVNDFLCFYVFIYRFFRIKSQMKMRAALFDVKGDEVFSIERSLLCTLYHL